MQDMLYTVIETLWVKLVSRRAARSDSSRKFRDRPFDSSRHFDRSFSFSLSSRSRSVEGFLGEISRVNCRLVNRIGRGRGFDVNGEENSVCDIQVTCSSFDRRKIQCRASRTWQQNLRYKLVQGFLSWQTVRSLRD